MPFAEEPALFGHSRNGGQMRHAEFDNRMDGSLKAGRRQAARAFGKLPATLTALLFTLMQLIVSATPVQATPAVKEISSFTVDTVYFGEHEVELCQSSFSDILPVLKTLPWYLTDSSKIRRSTAIVTDYISSNYIFDSDIWVMEEERDNIYALIGFDKYMGVAGNAVVEEDDSTSHIFIVLKGSCTGTIVPVGIRPPAVALSAEGVNASAGTAITPVTAEPSNFSDDAVLAYSVDPALPAGLSIDPDDGTISGTPTVSAATATYTVTATNQNDTDETGAGTVDIAVAKGEPDLHWLGSPPEISATYGDDPSTIFDTYLTSANTDTDTLSYAIGDTEIASESGGALTFLKPGTTTVTVTQAGDDDFNGDEINGAIAVAKQASMTTVAAGSGLIAGGAELTLTATVSPDKGGDIPTGQVAFTADGSQDLGSATLQPDGTASLKTSALAEGSHTISASYAGNDYYLASSSTDDASVEVDATRPTVELAGPDGPVTTSFNVTVTFSEDVEAITGDDIGVTGGAITGFLVSEADRVWTATIEPELGSTVTVTVAEGVTQDPAGNPNIAATPFTVQAGSPASKFEEDKEIIRQTIQQEALRTLGNTLRANRRMSMQARDRFIAARRGQPDLGGIPVNNYVEGFGGAFALARGSVSGQGGLRQPYVDLGGGYRQVAFGSFDVNWSDDGSVTGQAIGRLSWENMVSDRLMLSYFVGGEIGRSDLGGTYSGAQNSLGLSVGGNLVAELRDGLYLDGFVSLGVTRNELQMSDGTLDLTSDYLTTTGAIGGALTGVIKAPGFEIWPELSFSLGHTRIGGVGFVGTAYGLVDDTLFLDAGSVTVGTLMLRPEFRIPVDGLPMTDTASLISLSPRAICEFVRIDTTSGDCGGGAEIGYTRSFRANSTRLSAKVAVDRVGVTTNAGVELRFDMAF